MVEVETNAGGDSVRNEESHSTQISRENNRQGQVLLTLIGIAGGLLSAFVVNHFYPSDSDAPFPRVGLTVEETNLLRADPNDPVAHAINRQNSWDAFFRNTAFGIAIFAMICGVLLSFADGISCRSIGFALLLTLAAALLGLISGLLAGLDAAFCSLEMEKAAKGGGSAPTLFTLAMQGSILAIVGGAIGLGMAGTIRRFSVVLRGAAGGLVAGLMFLPLAAFLFPLQQTNLAIPESLLPKILFFVVAGGLIGFSIARTPKRIRLNEPVSTEPSPQTAKT